MKKKKLNDDPPYDAHVLMLQGSYEAMVTGFSNDHTICLIAVWNMFDAWGQCWTIKNTTARHLQKLQPGPTAPESKRCWLVISSSYPTWFILIKCLAYMGISTRFVAWKCHFSPFLVGHINITRFVGYIPRFVHELNPFGCKPSPHVWWNRWNLPLNCSWWVNAASWLVQSPILKPRNVSILKSLNADQAYDPSMVGQLHRGFRPKSQDVPSIFICSGLLWFIYHILPILCQYVSIFIFAQKNSHDFGSVKSIRLSWL